MTSQLFKADLNEIFVSPANAKQLVSATKAHTALLAWEKSGTMQDWKRFIRLYCKITEVEA